MTPRATLDDALASTFPASDPPSATSQTTATLPTDAGPPAPSTTTLTLYRVVPADKADTAFDGDANTNGSRWTSPGVPAVCAALTPAGALLEALAHLEGRTPEDWVLATATIDDVRMHALDPPPANWRERPYRDDVRRHGDEWIERNAALLLRVPSVLVPESWNVVVNPAHADAAHLHRGATMPIAVDPRVRS